MLLLKRVWYWYYTSFITEVLYKSALHHKWHAKFIKGVCFTYFSLCIQQLHRTPKVILQVETFLSAFFLHTYHISIPVEDLIFSVLCVTKVQKVMVLLCKVYGVADALFGILRQYGKLCANFRYTLDWGR